MTNEDRLKIDSLKGALKPSLNQMPIDQALLAQALKELAEEILTQSLSKA